MKSYWQDLRFALRTLRKDPGFAAAAILTLALGIGATSAVFSVVDGVLVRPLPYADADRLVLLWNRMESTGSRKMPISIPEVADFKSRSRSFADFAAMAKAADAVLAGDGEPEHVYLGRVTYNFFDLLGAEALVGRTFTAEDAVRQPRLDEGAEAPGAPSLLLLGHRVWRRRFGADPGVLGRAVRVNGRFAVVVGVLPADFEVLLPPDAGLAPDVDAWTAIPLDANPRERALRDEDADDTGAVLGRLKPGVTLAQARAEMEAIAAWQRRTDPFHAHAGTRIDVRPLHDDVVANAAPILRALAGAVGFVLLIACVNVALLVTARAGGREREMAVRAALGAGRGRLFRQVLTESGLLALLGSALGLFLAYLGLELLRVLEPARLPRLGEIGIDATVLGFTLASTLATTLTFGALSALDGSLRRGPEALKDRGAGAPSRRRMRLRSVLVVSEVALSLALLIGAGLLLRSFVQLLQVRPGFRPAGVLAFGLTLRDPARYRGPRERNEFSRQLEERLSALPGVEAVGLVSRLPLGGRVSVRQYGLEGQEPEVWSGNEADYRVITPDYFRALGARLLAGRAFTRADDTEDRRVVIVDEKLAARIAGGGKAALGRSLGLPVDGRRLWAEVVGVVEHVRHASLREDGRETIYVPYRHEASRDVSIVVRTSGDPAGLVQPVRRELRALDPELPVYDLRTMRDYVRAATASTRFTLVLVGLFACVALALATVGLYGVIAYLVRQRTREIAIRKALGAPASLLTRQVVGRGMLLAGLGLALGAAGSLAVSRMLESLLFGVEEARLSTCAAVSAVLLAAALLACYLPARKASRVDPMAVLRGE